MKSRFERLISGAFLLLILLLVGCGQAAVQDVTPSPTPRPEATLPVAASATRVQDPLAGTKWILLFLRGEHPLEDTRITIEFSGGFVRGSAGCNRYDRLVIGDDVARGKYKVTEDGSLTIPGLTITELGCPAPEGVMDQEKAYLDALRSAAAYRLVEDRLEIQNVARETILVYTRRAQSAEEPANLAGTAWQLVLVDGEVPVGGSSTTLAFLDEKWFVELSRCEGYVSSYETAGHDLSVDYSAWLGRVCQDEEGLGVTMLEEPSDFGLAQGRLQITMVSGRVFAYEPLPEEAQPALEGSTWSLLSVVGERWIEGEAVPMPDPIPILEGSEITLIFKGGMGSGSAGCNSYGSAYILDGTSLAFGDVVATERDCPTPEGIMDQEQRYLVALKGVTGYRMVGSQLWLLIDDGRGLILTAQGSRCVPGSVGPFPTTLQPADVLVQFDWEGGFTRWEASVPLGRVPVFTLLADGRAFYVAGGEHPHLAPAQTMVAHLTPSEAQALVQHVLDLGFECLASYTDRQWPLADGTVERVVDAGTSVLRVRLPSGELREITNYADFANDREALRAIRTFLDAYQHPQAVSYTPEKTTLFIQSTSGPSGVTTLDWPLDPAWLDPPQPGTVPWAALLTGSDLETLLAATGLNMGEFWFRDADRVFAVYLVPQIPGVDYTDLVTGSGQLLALKESSGSTEMPTPVPSCLPQVRTFRQAGSASRLIVEEHPLKTRPVSAETIPAAGPGLSAYFQTTDGDTGQILGRNQVLRDTHALMLASNNALLEPFGYRFALKKCGDAGGEWYILSHGDRVYQDPVYGLSPVSVNASNADFVMPLDLAHGTFVLTGGGLVRRDPADHLPVYVGDELLTARVSDAIEIYLGERLVYRDLVPPGPVPVLAPSSPWSYDGHWIVERIERIQGTSAITLRGHVIQDGQDLNQTCGYEESFGFALLDGRPFYFFRQEGKIDIAYDGQQVPMGYELVPHYRCCSVAALNPSTSQNMVWFFATRGYRWYYVEAYVPPDERPSLAACPTPAPALVPTVKSLPTPAALPGTPQPGAVWLRAKDSTDWKRIRYVPAGPFYMGSPEGLGGENEHPLHVVTLDPFWIDETEVTHGNYQICVEAGACDAQDVNGYDPLGRWAEPIEVTWDVAQAYCRWAGGRLPTEAEWEKAARGSDARTYPWGDDHPDCSRANYESLHGYCFNGVALAGSFLVGASPYGVMDMAGNVAEWVNDWYDPGYYAGSPEHNPPGPDSGQGRVVRGGLWYDTFPYIRAAYRDAYDPGDATAGLRCVVPAPTFSIVESSLYDGWYRYTNLDYGFSFHYPPDWTLEDKPHLITLRHKVDDTLRLVIEYRWASENIGQWRTGMPAGDFVLRSSVSFLGRQISRDVLVYEGKDKMVLYNYSSAIPWGDIVFGPILEVWGEQVDYEAVDLPQDVQRQIDQVVSSFELTKN